MPGTKWLLSKYLLGEWSLCWSEALTEEWKWGENSAPYPFKTIIKILICQGSHPPVRLSSFKTLRIPCNNLFSCFWRMDNLEEIPVKYHICDPRRKKKVLSTYTVYVLPSPSLKKKSQKRIHTSLVPNLDVSLCPGLWFLKTSTRYRRHQDHWEDSQEIRGGESQEGWGPAILIPLVSSGWWMRTLRTYTCKRRSRAM